MNAYNNNVHEHIRRMIERGSLATVFARLQSLSLSPEDADRLRTARTTYSQMLQYFRSGAEDPQRSELYIQVQESLYMLADSLERQQLFPASPTHYYTCVRNNAFNPVPALSVLLERAKLQAELQPEDCNEASYKLIYDTARHIFCNLWIARSISAADEKRLLEFLLSPENKVLIPAKAMALAGLLLGGLEFYDHARLRLLLTAYARSGESIVAARALLGATLLMMRHPLRSAGLPQGKSLGAEARERNSYGSEMRALVAALLRAYDSKRVGTRVEKEIIPGLMHLKPELEKRLGKIDPELLSESAESPDWIKDFYSSEVGEKLKEFTEMQSQGDDVFAGAFTRMKNFPFFSEMANWLLPFDPSHPALSDCDKDTQRIVAILSSAPVMCDSDKYSMALSLGHMPEAQAKLLKKHLPEQFNQMNEELTENLESLTSRGTEQEISHYATDLLRLLSAERWRGELYNCFDLAPKLPEAPIFEGLAGDARLLSLMADFYFTRKYWAQAADAYEKLTQCDEVDGVHFQKLGYCLEQYAGSAEALKAYRKAELLEKEPDSWLTKRVAACLRATGQYRAACRYYLKALEADPDSLSLNLQYGHALLEDGDVEHAMKQYYKVDFLHPGKAARPLAWCEFLTGKYDKSSARYRALLKEGTATSTDILNLGHALLCGGSPGEAIDAYGKVLAQEGEDRFATMLEPDVPTLLDKGVSPIDISLVKDSLIWK